MNASDFFRKHYKSFQTATDIMEDTSSKTAADFLLFGLTQEANEELKKLRNEYALLLKKEKKSGEDLSRMDEILSEMEKHEKEKEILHDISKEVVDLFLKLPAENTDIEEVRHEICVS